MSFLLLSLILTIIPIFLFNKKDITFKKYEFIIYSILTAIINYVLPSFLFKNINYIYITIGIILYVVYIFIVRKILKVRMW